MIIDNISIIICVALLLLTVVAVVANPFFRSVKVKEQENTTSDSHNLQPITVVVLSQNNIEALAQHLPMIMSQEYAPGYEVVVVGEKGDLDLEAVLNKYADNPMLYATYIPKRSLFMSKPKLSASLGIKAAHNEWIVMLNASCAPTSTLWLKTLAENIDNDKNLVIGYANYEDEVPSYRRFIRLREACYSLRCAIRGVAYNSCGSNIAFRRSEFIAKDGYRGNLQHVHGEYDFIVNKFAKPYASAVVLQPESFLRESCATKKSWSERCIANSHVSHYLKRRTGLRANYIADATFMYLDYAAIIAATTISALTGRYIALAVAVLCLIVTVALRVWLVKKKCRIFGENLSAWAIPFYELSLVWFDMLTKLRYARADKHDFSTHKI